MTAPETLAEAIAANLTWTRFNPEDGSTSVGYNDAAEIAAAVTTWLGQQGDVTDEAIRDVLLRTSFVENEIDRALESPTRREVDAAVPAVRSLLAQQAAAKDAEIKRLRTERDRSYIDKSVEHAARLRAEATVARQAAALDAVRAIHHPIRVATAGGQIIGAGGEIRTPDPMFAYRCACSRYAEVPCVTLAALDAVPASNSDPWGPHPFKGVEGVIGSSCVICHGPITDFVHHAAPSPEPQPLDEDEKR